MGTEAIGKLAEPFSDVLSVFLFRYRARRVSERLRCPECVILHTYFGKPRALPASEKSAGVPHSRDPATYGLIHKDHR